MIDPETIKEVIDSTMSKHKFKTTVGTSIVFALIVIWATLKISGGMREVTDALAKMDERQRQSEMMCWHVEDQRLFCNMLDRANRDKVAAFIVPDIEPIIATHKLHAGQRDGSQ
jgi:hypothetical protein